MRRPLPDDRSHRLLMGQSLCSFGQSSPEAKQACIHAHLLLDATD